MITLIEIIRLSEKYLAERGVARARREAEEVIADVLDLKRLDLYLQFDRPLNELELPRLRLAVQRRGNREPAAYISGAVSFAGSVFKVNSSVLIPRPETEILVDKIHQALQGESLVGKSLWDICCGSGCIGLSLKRALPDLEVTLSDLSEEALLLAKENGGSEVNYKQGDLFKPFSDLQCDFLVCNPPYIREDEFAGLDPEVKQWEPKMALISGPSGLEFYSRIAQELKHFLKPGGRAWLELGAGQGEAVQSLFVSQGWRCHYEPDWAGQDRFFYIYT